MKIETYPTNRIISAFENEMDWNKVNHYAEIMVYQGFNHEFPPIKGFECVIDQDDVNSNTVFMNGAPVLKENIGEKVWKVTDGHHRTFACIKAELGWIEVTKDFNTCVNEEELKEFYH